MRNNPFANLDAKTKRILRESFVEAFGANGSEKRKKVVKEMAEDVGKLLRQEYKMYKGEMWLWMLGKPVRAMTQLEICAEVAREAHAGQTRRDGTTPYINHPEDVARRVEGHGEDAQCVAWLHDVLEDAAYASEDLLRLGVPALIVDMVVLLTKVEDQSYKDYLIRINRNNMCRRVKIADMLSNLADDPTPKQVKKYREGLKLLGYAE